MTQPMPPAVKLSDVIATLDFVLKGHPHRDHFTRLLLDRYVPQMIEEIVAQRAVIMQFCEHLTALQQQMEQFAADSEQETTP